MAQRRSVRAAAVEKSLGYRFQDRDLMKRALTHASVKAGGALGNNERLEFLGDRVLGLVIAELLWRTHPADREGDLARKYNRLVRRETCARVARTIALGDHLILSESENASGGRDKDTILADAMEALLGAVFLDGGFERARAVVTTLWSDVAADGGPVAADPKSALQEWAQGRGLPLPSYHEISREGPDHSPVFVAEVRIEGVEPARGQGPSKRQAEQIAAHVMLERIGIDLPAAFDV